MNNHPSALGLDSEVLIEDDAVFRDLQGEGVVLNLKTGRYFGLDPVGTRIWQLLQQHHSVREVLRALLAEYEVSEEQCRDDLLRLLEQLREKQLVRVAV